MALDDEQDIRGVAAFGRLCAADPGFPRYRQEGLNFDGTFPMPTGIGPDPSRMLTRGALTRAGGSGGPLLWDDISTGRRYVVGVTQGYQGRSNRFNVTVARGGMNGDQPQPNTGAWLDHHLDP